MNLLIKTSLLSIVIVLTIFLFIRAAGLDEGLISDFIAAKEAIEIGDDENNDEEEKIFIVDGYKAIKLEKDVIITSGLQFGRLEAMSFKPEFIAFAEVINIETLVTLKAEYQQLLAEQRILQNNLHNHNKILKRAEALHKAKSLSTRDLEKTVQTVILTHRN